MNYPNSLNNLIESFKKLPGVGEKTAERYSYALIDNFDIVDAKLFSKSIMDVKEKIKKCKKCNNITENNECDICSNKNRNKKILCVVQDSKNIMLFEKLGIFDGQYFVIEKLISPINGIGPEDINIEKLFERIDDEKIEEIIIAIKPTIEGETTSLYISKMLENKKITVSKIARGIPIGTDMEYLDPLTIELAIKDRKEV